MKDCQTFIKIKKNIQNFFKNPAKAYLAISLIGVIGFVFITPPFQGPDEEVHYIRAQYIAHGYFIPTNTTGNVGLPDSIDYTLKETFFNNDIRGKSSANYEFWRTKKALKYKLNEVGGKKYNPIMITYNFLTYLPAIPGIALSNLFNLSPLFSLYVARLSLAVSSILLIYFAIKNIPIKKYLLFTIGLIPMMLFQQSVVGTDGLSYAIFILFLAYVVKLYFQQTEVDKKQWIKLLILCGLIIWSKPLLYVFLPLTIILVKKKNYWRWAAGAIILCGMLFVINNMMVSNQKMSYQTIGNQDGAPLNVDSSKQLSNLISHPKRFPRVLWNSYMTHFGDDEIRGVIGTFGYADVQYPIWMSYVYISIITCSVLIYDQNQKKALPKYWRFLAIILALIHFIGVNLAIYLGYTPFNFEIVYGVQGRYFLPAIAVLLLAFAGGQVVRSDSQKIKSYILIMSAIMVILAIFITYQRYFLFTP